MRKILLAALVTLLAFDVASAQMAYTPVPVPADDQKTTLNADDEDDMNRRRRRRRGRRGRGADMGLLISPQATLGLPMGDLADQNKMGFGLTVDALYYIDQLGVGIGTGFHSFGLADDLGYNSGSQSYIPILAQATYMFSTAEFKPYLGVGVGLYQTMLRGELVVPTIVGVDPVTQEPIFEDLTQDVSTNSGDFGLAPMAGFYYTLNDQMHLSGGLRYNMIMTEVEYSVTVAGQTISESESKTFSYLTINFGIGISLN